MRFTWTICGLAAAASLTLTPAFAGQTSHPAPVPTHAHAPKPTSASTTKPTKPTTTTPKFVNRIERNSLLTARLQPLLPLGMTLQSAAQGFKNEGQFIAALHVSKNLDIPFAQLKAEVTKPDHDSLGQAIHDLQPNADAKAAAKTAQEQAKTDIKVSRPAKPHKPDTDKDRDDR